MRRFLTDSLIALVLSLGSSSCLLAQTLTADRFLAGASAHPVGDQVEQGQFLKAVESLNGATPAEVQGEIPSIFQYALGRNDVHVRAYAAGFLVDIAIRPDGANLLSSRSAEISSLILDANPVIQRAAITVAYWVIGKAGANQQRYVSAFEAAIERAQTPQDIDVRMVSLLSRLGSSDPVALKSVLDFMHRGDLTVSTRIDLVHSLGVAPGLAEEVSLALTKDLDDPDPRVRAAALVAFADSRTAYHSLAKSRVERMANDSQENAQVRELAKEALAGRAGLSPNINMPPDTPKDH